MTTRTLHLTRDFPPRSAGGVSTAVGGMVARRAATGARQAVVSFDAWRPSSNARASITIDDHGGVPVLRVLGGAPGPELARFGAAFAPDEVWLHDGLVARHAPQHGVRVQVVHVLSHLQDRLRGAPPTATTMALASALQAAERVVVTTASARALLCADHPELAARTVVEPLVSTLPTRPRTSDAARGPIVVAGRFDVLKGTDLIVAALPRLLALRPVVLAGGVPENRGAERRWASRLGGDGAELVGWLAPDALAELFARAAIVVAPSRLETCGLALLEAVAAGVPTVASDIPAHREVAPGSRFFASGDAAALADAAAGLVITAESR